MSQYLINPYSFGAAAAAVGGWVEVARTTLGSAGDSVSVTGIPDKRYYTVLGHIIPSARVFCDARLNNDTSGNYSQRRSVSGGGDSGITGQTFLTQASFTTTDAPSLHINYLSNLSSAEKTCQCWSMEQNTAGAANIPIRNEIVAKHAQTSNPISRWDYTNTFTGDYDTNSEVVVLGWDPADTHTDNFWEQLANVTAGGSSTNLSSGTITAKKYLWIMAYLEPASSSASQLTFNNDTTTYSYRVSDDGAADTTSASQALIQTFSATATPVFVNMFVINNSANEKLVLGHTINQNTAGEGNAPARREFAGKWDNTASQITEVDLDSSSGNWNSNSAMAVWGSD